MATIATCDHKLNKNDYDLNKYGWKYLFFNWVDRIRLLMITTLISIALPFNNWNIRQRRNSSISNKFFIQLINQLHFLLSAFHLSWDTYIKGPCWLALAYTCLVGVPDLVAWSSLGNLGAPTLISGRLLQLTWSSKYINFLYQFHFLAYRFISWQKCWSTRCDRQ